MASKSKSSVGGSPSKRSQLAANGKLAIFPNLSLDSISKDFILMDKDVLRGLSEKEVEIEHLKTTVVALSQKIEIIKDYEQDVQNHQALA